ncbi:MAG TPA: caspase family protein [Candidatus Obscuribacterales bacterium]
MSRGFSRRHVLQGMGATLAALGWSQGAMRGWGDRYGRALAQATPRKLALLVGINDYPQDGLFAPLNGCVNDVELQYHLLVHRFGFHPDDIIKLTDQQATRAAILTAFEEHLIKQAKPGDVAVFHFSGHGSRVVDPDQDFPDGLNSTLVPVDSPLPEGFPRSGGPVNDITGHTLFLLGSALPTDNFTMVLDSCHSGGAKRGNLAIRARPGGNGLTMSAAELAYQAAWLPQLNLSPASFIERRRQGIAKGAAIASARRDQYAADAPFQDFYAGAFTFVLTQYLWQQTGSTPFDSTLGNVARTTTQLSFSSQEPQFETQPGGSVDAAPIYFTQKVAAPAEAVVTNVAEGEVEVWLGGVDPRSLEVFGAGAVLAGVDATGAARGLVQLTQRQGLTGRGRLLADTALASGALLQEQVRGVPMNVTLRVGLDASLGAAATAAQTALAAIPRVEPLALGGEEVHYILGQMTAAYREQLAEQANVPAVGSFGLFSQGLELVPDSYGNPGETVTAAVARLRPKLRSLLAARLMKLTLNPGSSRLNLRVTMIPETGNQVLASAFTVRGSGASEAPPAPRPGVEQIPLNTGIRFQIENRENRDLYLSVLVVDAAGIMAVIFPNQWTAATAATLLPAGATLLLPDPNRDRFRLVTQEPKGTTEVLIVASSNPLDQALRGLQAIADEAGVARGPLGIADPTAVVDGLLQDVGGTRSSDPTVQAVSVSQLAALSLTFDVI